MRRTLLSQEPGPRRYWALLHQWVASMKVWADGSKLLVVHDNAESILSEQTGSKVRSAKNRNAGSSALV